jgi:hypothetical protein
MAKARGQSRRAAKEFLAINAGCGADELARRRNREQGLVSGVQSPSWPIPPLDSCSFSASRFIRPAMSLVGSRGSIERSTNGHALHRCIAIGHSAGAVIGITPSARCSTRRRMIATSYCPSKRIPLSAAD